MAVYQRKGTWWIDYYHQGTRYRQKIGSRRRDAEEAFSKIKVKIAAGEFVPPEERRRQQALDPQQVQFEAFALEEFLPWSEAQHSARHYQRLASVVRFHLLPFFGKHTMGEVTPKLIEDYKGMRHRGRYTRGRQVKAVKGATVNRELCCIKLLLRKAVEWGRLEESPARKVKMFKARVWELVDNSFYNLSI